MPIVDVQLVLPDTQPSAPGLARALADALGAGLGSPPGHLWLRLHVLPASQYAENLAAAAPPVLPVFVTVLHRQPPEGAARQAEVKALVAAAAACLGRPPHAVHVEYAAPGAGRVAFGGQLVE